MQTAIQRAIDGLELSADSTGDMQSIFTPSRTLNHVSLHKHQTEGVEWMLKRWKCGKSVIVADEMGLGKTLQTLAFVSVLLEQKSLTGPFLVIAPLSVAPQWISQANTFIPDLRMFRYLGSADERELLRRGLIEDHILKLPREVLESGDPQPLPFDVMVTSYETCLADIDFVEQFKWRVIVFDEGHRLKNPDGVTHTAFLGRLHANFKVILTGTPIQNNITEFWALLRFLNPDIFTDNTKPDVGDSPSGMDLLVQALVLRRLAASSSLQLPPIDNLVIRTEMTKIQSDLYRWALFHYALSVRGESDSSVVPPGILSNLMMTLRKISAHPYLLPGVEPEPFSEGPHIWLNSNKFIVLRSLLQKMKREKSRCLIFSTFTSLLDICQDFLDLESIAYERLDGSVRSEERTAAIDRFTTDLADVFLLSTRAGGVGLNLTAADWVIFLDTDWNPQMDLQAIARAFRQGQTKRVKVFRLVTEGTIDELIFRRSLEKLKFASDLLGESVPPSSEMKSMVFKGASKLVLELASHEMPAAQRLVDETPIDLESLIESTDESDLVISDYKQFKGIDYAEKHVEISPTIPSDLEAMNRLMERAGSVPRAALIKQPPVVSEMKERAQKMTREMRRKRKEEKWRQINYWSRAIGDGVQEGVVSHGQPGEVRHVIGSFTEPLGDTQKAVIVHIVDNSGIWPLNSRLFMSIGEKFPKIPKIYFLSKKANDLRFGDVHVFSQSDLEPCVDDRVCVALCVCHRNQDFDLLVQCLSKLSSHFSGQKVSFHFSRIGDRRGKFYVTERIIRRYICASGADAYVYHYIREPPKKLTLLDYFKSVVPVSKPVSSAPVEKPSVWLSPEIHRDLRTLYSRMLLRNSCNVSEDTERRHDVYVVSALDGRKGAQELMSQLNKKFGVAPTIEIPNTFEKDEKHPTIMTTEMLEYMIGIKMDIV